MLLIVPIRKLTFEPREYYHVFNRGFCKMTIFSHPDAYVFVKKSLELSNKFGVFIESQAIMLNHFHFILFQRENNEGIRKFMYHLQMSFAKYFNRKYKRRGQVFEGRFRAKIVDSDKYYWNVTNYVFRNPFK